MPVLQALVPVPGIGDEDTGIDVSISSLACAERAVLQAWQTLQHALEKLVEPYALQACEQFLNFWRIVGQ